MIMELIFVLLAFLTGYFLGRRLGHQAGMEEGGSVAALLLRQRSLEQGECVLCRTTYRQNHEKRYKDSSGNR